MSEATFTFRVDGDLKAEFVSAAKARDRSGAQLLRDFMREYVQQQREVVGVKREGPTRKESNTTKSTSPRHGTFRDHPTVPAREPQLAPTPPSPHRAAALSVAQAGWAMDRAGRVSGGTAGENHCQEGAVGDYRGVRTQEGLAHKGFEKS